MANKKEKRLNREEIQKRRKDAIAKFEKDHLGYKVISVKVGGLQLNAVVEQASFDLLEQNWLPAGKLPRVTLAQGANPGTKQVVPIEWVSKSEKRFEVLGSIIYIGDDGKAIGNPGIIA